LKSITFDDVVLDGLEGALSDYQASIEASRQHDFDHLHFDCGTLDALKQPERKDAGGAGRSDLPEGWNETTMFTVRILKKNRSIRRQSHKTGLGPGADDLILLEKSEDAGQVQPWIITLLDNGQVLVSAHADLHHDVENKVVHDHPFGYQLAAECVSFVVNKYALLLKDQDSSDPNEEQRFKPWLRKITQDWGVELLQKDATEDDIDEFHSNVLNALSRERKSVQTMKKAFKEGHA